MPRYLFNKTQLKKLIDESPKDTNVIGIFVHHVESGKGLVPKVQAKALKFNTTTGAHTASETAVATGTPSCPNPPGCTGTITAVLGLS